MLTATVQPQNETSCSQANLCHAFAQSELRVPKLLGEPRVSKTAKPVLVNCDQPTEKRSAFLKFSKTVAAYFICIQYSSVFSICIHMTYFNGLKTQSSP